MTKTEANGFDIIRMPLNDHSDHQENHLDIAYYAGLIWRYRWLAMAIFCIAMICGIYLAIILPKIYQAETLILIEPPSVPENYVRSIVSTDLNLRLSNITQMIKSRTNLMKIIDEFNLFSGPDNENMYMEDKIEAMRKLISVGLITGKRRRTANAFTISFKGKDPSKVTKVVNAMASQVMDQNLKRRESRAVGTSQFLNDQLIKMRENLVTVEKALGDYRKNYMGELPEQLKGNQMALDRLQQQLGVQQMELRNEKNRLISIENQLQLAREQSRQGIAPLSQDEENSLEALKQKLRELKTHYTERHPDVVRLKRQIVEMEEENARLPENAGMESERETTPMEAKLILQRNQVEREIDIIKEKISSLDKKIDFYQRRVEDTPKREQELLSLKRNYKNIQGTYSSLLNRKLEAEIASSMEKSQKGEQFRIIDPARLPDKPLSPDMKRLFLACLAAGLGGAIGLILLFNYFDGTVKNPEIVSNRLGIPVLAVMPTIKRRKDILWRRMNIVFSMLGAIVSLALLACLGAVTILDIHWVVNLIKNFINI